MAPQQQPPADGRSAAKRPASSRPTTRRRSSRSAASDGGTGERKPATPRKSTRRPRTAAAPPTPPGGGEGSGGTPRHPPRPERRTWIAVALLILLLVLVAGVAWQLGQRSAEESREEGPAPTLAQRPATTPAPPPLRATHKPAPPPRPAEPPAQEPRETPPATVASTTPAPGAAAPPPGGVVYEEHFAPEPSLPPPLPPRTPPGPEERRQPLPPGVPIPVAVIIDDLGYHETVSLAIAKLPADLTLAILPAGPHAREVARTGAAQGKEVILHQPMEPSGGPKVNAGPGALLSQMDQPTVRATLRKNLSLLPEAVGVNNHMGSLLTQNATIMGWVMEELRERGLYFVDSRTTGSSRAHQQAVAHQVPRAERDVFIDNTHQVRAILGQLHKLEERARRQGGAIGIGHPYPETLEALRSWLPGLQGKGFQVVRASQLLGPVTARARYPSNALAMRRP